MTLLASAETVLGRAQADPSSGRVVSKLPVVQAHLNAEFEGVLPFLRERSQIVSAEESSPEQLEMTIVEMVLTTNSSEPSPAAQLG